MHQINIAKIIFCFRNVDTKVAQVTLGINQYLSTVQFFDGNGGNRSTNIETMNLLDCDVFK